ncbi:MAG: hypothetical protein V2I57_04880 [Xanthomonadales bacterium]|jgi:hypothetical protein|nr:hypothetical protein [Xanthomonadales bacterium]
MSASRLFFVCLALGAALLLWRCDNAPVTHGPGVLVPSVPEQQPVAARTIGHGEYALNTRARFDLQARVLSRRDYRFDRGADLVPVDLALGWGPMSDSTVLDRIEVRQSGRWYHLRWDFPEPLPERVAMGHSGNMHLIPANDGIRDDLDEVREGDLVRLSGYLVDASGPNGFTWTTSLSRDDTGGGSCELFYVERVLLLTP